MNSGGIVEKVPKRVMDNEENVNSNYIVDVKSSGIRKNDRKRRVIEKPPVEALEYESSINQDNA